jgi:uncharacterized protein Veg
VTTTSYVWQQDSDMGETCFTSKKSAKEIVSTIEKAARPLGFNVQIQNHKIKLKADKEGRKGQLSVSTQVFEVAPSLFMVEMSKNNGDTIEYQNVSIQSHLPHSLQSKKNSVTIFCL